MKFSWKANNENVKFLPHALFAWRHLLQNWKLIQMTNLLVNDIFILIDPTSCITWHFDNVKWYFEMKSVEYWSRIILLFIHLPLSTLIILLLVPVAILNQRVGGWREKCNFFHFHFKNVMRNINLQKIPWTFYKRSGLCKNNISVSFQGLKVKNKAKLFQDFDKNIG